MIRILLSILLAMVNGAFAFGYSVDDPVVQRMVRSGADALAVNVESQPHYSLNLVYSGGHGEVCLAGYAMMKVEHDAKNPVVRRGIQAAISYLGLLRNSKERNYKGSENKALYTASTAVLVLAEANKQKYRKQLKQYEGFFRAIRSANGGYAYPGDDRGDVSQTQYAILALWTLDKAGINIDYSGVKSTISWLLRVQDTSGGWPYLGVDPGRNQGKKQQQAVSPSMAIAGGSAVMIAADILEVWKGSGEVNSTGYSGMPKAVKRATEELLVDERTANKPTYDSAVIRNAIRECHSYIRQSKNSPDPSKVQSSWPYYQLYTLERYESFRAMAFGGGYQELPGWYDMGVQYLKTKQAKQGWPGRSYTTSSVSTSFAILFLIQGTKLAIEEARMGSMAGGQGLPKSTMNITVNGTKIQGETVSAAVEDLLASLEDDDTASTEGKSIPDNLKLATNPRERQAQLDRLERLVRGSRSWQARRVAAKLLGKSDEMRVVPAMIYALSDPDSSVKRYARDGLRFISRKFEGFGMPDKPSDGQIDQAQRKWRKWYLSMDPTYVFITD